MTVAVVWYSSWQMECCGEPFAVGDIVTWHLDGEPEPAWYLSALGPEVGQRITHEEEHHPTDEDFPEFTGRVVTITRNWCEYGPVGIDDRVHHPIAGTYRFQPVDRAEGAAEHSSSGLIFNGWVVELSLDGPSFT